MSDDKNINFQDTVDWATMEDSRREPRSKGIPTFYLVIGAFIIFILVVLGIYLLSGSKSDNELDALEMMKNEKYVFDENNYDNPDPDNNDGYDYDQTYYEDGTYDNLELPPLDGDLPDAPDAIR